MRPYAMRRFSRAKALISARLGGSARYNKFSVRFRRLTTPARYRAFGVNKRRHDDNV
jgi:hypothetical protein